MKERRLEDALVFGQLIEQYDFEATSRDESGLGRWVFLVFRGSNNIITRIICSYCPCKSKTIATQSSYQTTPPILYQEGEGSDLPMDTMLT
jgi:hypothetical protein